MTIDTEKLSALAHKATPIYTSLCGDRYLNDVYSHAELTKEEDAFVTTFTPQTILTLLDELDRLHEQVRQHEAFQQFANATEQQRLNDARLEGWKAAQEHAGKACDDVAQMYIDDSNKYTALPLINECAANIRAMQPPTEWANSEQCGGAPNIATLINEGAKWPHDDGFGGGLMGDE